MTNFNYIVMMLQIFAEGGEVVNVTDGYTNAYTGDHTNFSGAWADTATLELKTFYDTELLENTRVETFYAQFAKKQRLPKNHGTTIEWRKPGTFAKASVLQEAVIPTGQQFGMTSKTGFIYQMGTYTAVSEKVDMHAYDPMVLIMTEEMGASAAETQETLIRDALLANTNVLYCDNITIATGAVESTPTNPNSSASGAIPMKDTASIHCYLTDKMVNKAVTLMKKNRVPRINGKYVAVIHPSVAEDLRNCAGWIEAHKYAQPTEIYNGEIGELHGCRFIEDTFAPVLGGDDYKNAANGMTYATYFFGKDAFGVIDPEGGSLETIVKDKSEVGGPLEQFSTIGYKLETNGATMLYPERVLRVMSCSSYSATDETNYDADFYPSFD